MSDTPKFEVIDRRKYKAEEEERNSAPTQAESAAPPSAPAPAPEPGASKQDAAPKHPGPKLVIPDPPKQESEEDLAGDPQLPPAPTAEESREQKSAYDASAQRLEDLVRAQNPGVGAQPPVNFEQLVQQFYLSAMIQMGAGTQEGQRPRIDILGARQTIDLIAILAEKTRGNLTDTEDRVLQAVLFEARMAFLELTNMITLQGVQAPLPPKK